MITDKLIKLVSHYESLHDGDLSHIGLQPKMDPIGIWTEGYGKVILDRDGKMIRGAENKEKAYSYHKLNTIEDATKMLKVDLELFAKQIDKLKLDLTQNQYEALISFSYSRYKFHISGSNCSSAFITVLSPICSFASLRLIGWPW